MRYCIMRPYTEGRLDRYRIDIPRELSKIRTQPWLSEGSLILSDPGTYFRQLTIREEGLLKPPPLTISKTIVSIFTISYMCILPGVLDMFQLEFFQNSRFLPFHSEFKIKSSENSCKNNIFVILFKIDFKYTKRRSILMRI